MDINNIVQQLVILAPPFLFAITFHELAHGYIAWRLGDPTAKDQGRLTMNPIKHIDPLGVLAFIIMKIGWAKPVPVNPMYFKDPRQGMLLVALAGPGANIFYLPAPFNNRIAKHIKFSFIQKCRCCCRALSLQYRSFFFADYFILGDCFNFWK